MYKRLSSRMIRLKRAIYAKRRRAARKKKIREQKKTIKRVALSFVGITGIVLIWSSISRYAETNLTMGDSLAIGFGLLFVSGLLTKRFIRTFA